MNKFRAAVYISIPILLLGGSVFAYTRGETLASLITTIPGFQKIAAPYAVSTASSTILITYPAVPVTSTSTADSAITIKSVIALTNVERSTQADLPPLAENVQLDAAAAAKLQDMFAEQYFAHVSPKGVGPGDVAEAAGYNYVMEGENLAEGDFKSVQDLLDAWMASPGHRANILNTRYLDIGVAVGQGLYDGQEVWMAVQEFGKPLSACPVVDTSLHDAITSNQSKAAGLSTELGAIKQALVAVATGTPDENSSYNQIANHYNADVDLYNGVVTRLKAEITSYNNEVESFNACVNG